MPDWKVRQEKSKVNYSTESFTTNNKTSRWSLNECYTTYYENGKLTIEILWINKILLTMFESQSILFVVPNDDVTNWNEVQSWSVFCVVSSHSFPYLSMANIRTVWSWSGERVYICLYFVLQLNRHIKVFLASLNNSWLLESICSSFHFPIYHINTLVLF
jgi:hypothetical protein